MNDFVVMKFGGTSVGSSERIGEVAKRVSKFIDQTGKGVVMVVSAMSGETDRLLDLCRKCGSEKLNTREVDQAIAAGEQVSAALTALALQKVGKKAKSLTAEQIPIRTEEIFGQNLISDIDVESLKKMLADGVVPVVAGFQGINPVGDVTTLGRGGSDNTAVAIAAKLGPSKCYIYTDIDGVYTALPSVCRQAKKLQWLTYEEMLELASSGAKVLQARSVALAKKFKVPLVVCSSFSDKEGTEIVEEYQGMEDAVVSGITCRSDEAKLTVRNIPDKPGMAAAILSALAENGVNVDMIVQTQGTGAKATLGFTVPLENAAISYDTIIALTRTVIPEATVEMDKNMAKLTVVGEGMRTHTGVAAKMFELLGKEGINVEMITTSEIKISVVIPQKYSELAVRTLHEHFIEAKK